MLQFKKKLKKKKKDKRDINSLEAEAISSGLGVGDLGSRKDVKRQAMNVQQERLKAEESKLLADQNPKMVFTEMEEFVRGLHIDEEARKAEHVDVFMYDDKDAIEEEKPNSEENKEIILIPVETIREVAVGKGLSGALKLLQDRGTLKETIDESGGGRNIDKKEIHIERTDEFGRILTPKEAFRLICHKFHGKGPGKMKQEKRMKQYYQELKMKQMKTSDTPLLSVERMREIQSRLKTPYLVLS